MRAMDSLQLLLQLDRHNSSPHSNGLTDNPDFILASKVLVGITASLSLIGGSLIVLSWLVSVCRRDSLANPAPKPSPARHVLLNLSIADVLVAVSHLVGLAMDYQKHDRDASVRITCVVQGSIATGSTVASFLWTITLTFLATVTLMLRRPKKFGTMKALLVYVLVCWGIPLALVIAFFPMKAYDYDEDDNLLWCYTKPWGADTVQRDIFNMLSYDMWLLITMVSLTVLLCAVCCHNLRRRRRGVDDENLPLVDEHLHERGDYKMVFVAVILIALRLWDIPVEFMLYDEGLAQKFSHSRTAAILLLMGGVCDSAQGFANAVLFLLFTRDYRQWMWRGVRECCCPPARPRPRQSAQHSLHSGVNADYVSPYDDDHSAPLPQ